MALWSIGAILSLLTPCWAQQPRQGTGTEALFQQRLRLSGDEPEIFDADDRRIYAITMQSFLQGAFCAVDEQRLVEDDDLEATVEADDDEEEESYLLEIDFRCMLPGGPGLATQYLNFVSRQDVTFALVRQGFPVEEAYAPIAREEDGTSMADAPTFAPVTAGDVFELAFLQQYFALHPGSSGFTPLQEMVIALELQTITTTHVVPGLLTNDIGSITTAGASLDVACGVPPRGQQVTVTGDQAISILQLQCSFSSAGSDNWDQQLLAQLPPALINYTNANLDTMTTSLQQKGLAALVQAEALQMVAAPTLAPSPMPVPLTDAPTLPLPTATPTIAPTVLTLVNGSFVQRFVMNERREGQVLDDDDDDEVASVVEVWQEFAAAAVPEADSVTCEITEQSVMEQDTIDTADMLRTDYECQFSAGPSANLTDAAAAFVTYMNENLEEFTDSLENFLRLDEALPVRLATEATAAPTPIPLSNRRVGEYRQEFVVEDASVLDMLRTEAAAIEFLFYVESLVEEFGDNQVLTRCAIDNEILIEESSTNQTVIQMDYSCTYSSLETDVSSYPDEYISYVNEALEEFTRNMERDVAEGVLETREVVALADVTDRSETVAPTMVPVPSGSETFSNTTIAAVPGTADNNSRTPTSENQGETPVLPSTAAQTSTAWKGAASIHVLFALASVLLFMW